MRTGSSVDSQGFRPPNPHAVSSAEGPVRPSARVRPTVSVKIADWPGDVSIYDPYVRRFWVAAIGAGAVAELLRLARCAERGESVRLPRNLPILLRTGLARATSAGLMVSLRVPAVPREMRWRFPPSLHSDHTRWVRELTPGRENGHQEEGGPLSNGKRGGDPDVRLPTQDQ